MPFRPNVSVVLGFCLAVAGCSSGPVASSTPTMASPSPSLTPNPVSDSAANPTSQSPVGSSNGSSGNPKPAGPSGSVPALSVSEPPDPVKASAPFRPDPPDVLPLRAEKMPGYAQVRSMAVPSLGQSEVSQGGRLWKQNCAPCHGMDGTGNPKFPTASGPDLRRAYLYKYGSSAKAIFRTIEFGIPRTPMGQLKGQLSASETWALVAYTQSLIQGVEMKAEIQNP